MSASIISMQRTVARMDRFALSLPSFKAAHLVKAEVDFIVEALDKASGADDASLFDVHMDSAHAAVLRVKRHLTALEAELQRGRAQHVGGGR